MQVFKMNGVQITGIREFRSNFSPLDFLRSCELAAGFAYHHLRQLSAWEKYSSELLFNAVFPKNLNEPMTRPEDYFKSDVRILCLTSREQEVLDNTALQDNVRQTLQALWNLVQQTILEKAEKKRLFVILASGYLLTDSTLESHPVAPSDVCAAFLKQELPDKDSHLWITFDGSSVLHLTARPEPYRILLTKNAAARLKADSLIRLCRIDAVKDPNEKKHTSVTINVYRSKQDPDPESTTVSIGDYRYISLVENEPVLLHPIIVQNGECIMLREKNTFRLKTAGKADRTFSCAGKDVVSFAPEAQGQGWILAEPDSIDLSNYSLQHIYENQLDVWNVVQVKMHDNTCLLLDNSGRVTSNILNIHLSGVVSLDAAELPL